ncbi:cyclin-dependent kinases regulatory subunit [Anaeramoeba ignava]|uniref:Cyclin-dependent kinases regulatory subunit n=1 Tax=Anaeramoeba ignava TaxID=1746090 RepID=A0A9Q0LF19_ANAIG|nr:cyclin-dependent kinases regulatory subunit [Anaeramoeba ignava]
MADDIYYSPKYYDDEFEYRHVILPKTMGRKIPSDHLLSETEWRAIGICMSRGWIHYHYHKPEPNILLFRRPLTEDQKHLQKQLGTQQI